MKETLNAKSLESTPDHQTGWEHKNRKNNEKATGKNEIPAIA